MPLGTLENYIPDPNLGLSISWALSKSSVPVSSSLMPALLQYYHPYIHQLESHPHLRPSRWSRSLVPTSCPSLYSGSLSTRQSLILATFLYTKPFFLCSSWIPTNTFPLWPPLLEPYISHQLLWLAVFTIPGLVPWLLGQTRGNYYSQ